MTEVIVKRVCRTVFLAPALLFGAALLLVSVSARASESCPEEDAAMKALSELEASRDAAAEGSVEKRSLTIRVGTAQQRLTAAVRACENKLTKAANDMTGMAECKAKQVEYENQARAQKPPGKIMEVFRWEGGKCVNLAANTKSITDADECNNASLFTELKGKNCKVALESVKSVKARTSAVTESTTAATTAYAGMQAMQATGAQDDAQSKQANVMQALAISKFATGALNLQGAMELKGAASGAEAAQSNISGAQQNLAQACANATDEQLCFYQNAQRFGIERNTLNYANFERMKRGAAQSQEQADAANALAKQSMITGAADMLVGLQAMKMAQMAQQNSQAMAPPPVGIPPPLGTVSLHSGQSAGSPGVAPGEVMAPVDYGNPSDGSTFGGLNKGRIEGTMAAGKMGTPTIFKPAASGLSGGGGGGGSASSGRGKGGKNNRPKSGVRNTALGEITHGNSVGFKGGGEKGGDGGAAAANPFADALAKLFPQDQSGKPVVDARQIASGGVFGEESQTEGATEVTSSDLSIFEQITSKYRQLDGSGRF